VIRPVRRVAVVAVVCTAVALGSAGGPAAGPAGAAECNFTPDGRTDVPWAQQRLQPERAWPITRGEGVVVAVIDSGVDARNRHLRGRVFNGGDVLGPPGGPATRDCSGHGTLVAGVVVGQPTAGSPFAGVAPGALVLSVRQNEVRPGVGQRGDTNGLARAIKLAVDRRAKVINVSATSPVDTPALREAVRYATLRNVLIVAAAGNDDPQRGAAASPPVFYPAAYPDVIAVAATDRDDLRGEHLARGVLRRRRSPWRRHHQHRPERSGHLRGGERHQLRRTVRRRHRGSRPRVPPRAVRARGRGAHRGHRGPALRRRRGRRCGRGQPVRRRHGGTASSNSASRSWTGGAAGAGAGGRHSAAGRRSASAAVDGRSGATA
jgi:hypothetical protein